MQKEIRHETNKKKKWKKDQQKENIVMVISASAWEKQK